MKALFIESDQQTAGVIANFLESELGFETNYRSNLKDGLEWLKQNPLIDLIVVRKVIGASKTQDGDEAARAICSYIYDQNLKCAVVCLGEFEYVGVKLACLPDHFKLNDFSKTVVKVMGLTREEIADMKLPDFVPVPVSYFFLMNKASCDIYMKLKKGDNEEFVKRIHAHDEFDKEAVMRYNVKFGLKEFYVQKHDRQMFYDSLILQSTEKLSTQAETMEVRVERIADSFGIAKNLLCAAGVDDRSVKMANATIGAMKETITSNDRLGGLLKKLLGNQSSYAYKHSFLISLFFPKLLSKMEWCPKSQVQQTFEKMVFISFFHDIYIEDDKLVMINDKESFKNANLTEAEKTLVLNHANKAANLVQSFPHSPPGVDVIIRQHHGMSNGVGFIDTHGINISPISILFIVVESFVHELLLIPQTKKKMATILEELYQRFPMGTYKKIIDTLKESLTGDF